ncbi:sulfotransferase domain-containing protein [Labrys okinawensis]|uniref:sulfotransferase domain-containing protein n=1 Tax=Labrys okinawensis TaxID=346911 RepID=UPI0039BD53AA
MPKSGSTFLSDVISQLPGWTRAIPVPSGCRREQELDESCLQQVNDINYVAQLHVRYSDWTDQMCHDYRIKPVVLIRSLYDAVVSIRDHLRNESHIWPMIFLEPYHADLDDATLDRMIIRLALPWYLNFYMSWRKARHALILSYEEVVADPAKAVRDILSFAGATVGASDIEAAVQFVRNAKASRLNVGVSGRGNALSPEAVRDVLALLALYPEAAADPYFQMLNAHGAAILAGEALPPSIVPAAPRVVRTTLPQRSPSPIDSNQWNELLIRRFVPALLVSLAVIYWLLPIDLIPDAAPYGMVDHVVALIVLVFLAGRLTRHRSRVKKRKQKTRASGIPSRAL